MSIRRTYPEKLVSRLQYEQIAPGQLYTYEKDLLPYQSIDPHKVFFNLIDYINFDVLPEDNDFLSDESSLLIVANVRNSGLVRSQNHFWNSIGQFRVLINGQVVEQRTHNIGELDTVIKRMNRSTYYNVHKDHSNFNKTYRERYLEQTHSYLESQHFPDFSKFFTQQEQIVGGIKLRVEFTLHPDLFNRAVYCLGTLPYETATGGVVGNTYLADDRLSPVDNSIVLNYNWKSVDLWLEIEENAYYPPVLKPLIYSQNRWFMDQRSLESGRKSFDFQINVPKDLKCFGFVFQHNTASSSIELECVDFTGKPAPVDRFIDNDLEGEDDKHRQYTGNQSCLLTYYQVEYGKYKLPYDYINQNFTVNSDGLDTDNKYTLSQLQYMRYLLHGFHNTGGYDKEQITTVTGPIYLEKFPNIVDNDQDYIKVKLEFSENVSNLNMLYFYSQDATLELNYDATQTAVQVVSYRWD